MKKMTILWATFATSMLMTGTVMAQQFKMGYVSLDRLMAESAPAKTARSTLDSQFKPREASLDTKAAAIRSKQQAYEKDFPKLTDAQRAEREKDLGQSMDAFEAERAKFEEDLSVAQNKMLQDLLNKANAVIKSLAEKEGYDLIVQDAVYIKPEYDLTRRVIEQLR
ncbi:OmpH family outer membrane protein [Hydromonas duriensis]|uniref:Periplasmic chaperone for outer membrane proteins Skp n=1 Tax=Hydromonas duriensis TaxID=1527608 RepID=A0A4R6Y8I1_9BURK|nr:OmpH family outer membrane protein [Hydromonas duriensis]TDR31681.1 periplasmic chaperone for outer membrane proteins Skp [Hydromonas duriensis]